MVRLCASILCVLMAAAPVVGQAPAPAREQVLASSVGHALQDSAYAGGGGRVFLIGRTWSACLSTDSLGIGVHFCEPRESAGALPPLARDVVPDRMTICDAVVNECMHAPSVAVLSVSEPVIAGDTARVVIEWRRNGPVPGAPAWGMGYVLTVVRRAGAWIARFRTSEWES